MIFYDFLKLLHLLLLHEELSWLESAKIILSHLIDFIPLFRKNNKIFITSLFGPVANAFFVFDINKTLEECIFKSYNLAVTILIDARTLLFRYLKNII